MMDKLVETSLWQLHILIYHAFLQRGIDQPGIDSFDKNVLVDVYNHYLLPLPQRKYRMNRRGQQMTKKQIILAKTSKTPSDAEIKK